MTPGQVVDAFGSDFIGVEVRTRADGAFDWTSTPGPSGPAQLGAVRASTGAPTGTAACRWVWPRPSGRGLRFTVPGPSSAARWLSAADLDLARQAAPAVLASAVSVVEVGALTGVEARESPAPIRRLIAHLRAEQPVPATRQWRAACVREVGASAWSRLVDTVDQTYADVTDLLTRHGGLSIGGIIPATVGEAPALLTGPDVGRAPQGHDLGWLLGELIELGHGADLARRELLRSLAREVQRCHRGPTDELLVPALSRILAHAEDYAAHVGWHESLTGRARVLGPLLEALADEEDGVDRDLWAVVF